ncbi:MAG TPA: dihydroorotate dehydrogenase [Thermoanaerobaculia bacterium]|nr:dihydroorotate dehydrogenase [Thermoanaerobaculia bacterium]
MTASDLSVRLGPIALANPVATASGTFGYGLEFADVVDLSAIGALFTKGLSLRPHEGNAPPRICETPSGMLNAIGLQNVGIEAFLSEKLPRLAAARATVFANIWGDEEEEYVEIVRALAGAPGLAGIELNISCPNVRRGGMLFGNSPEATASLVGKVRKATAAPLVVKLSPNAPDLVESARAACGAGADVLSLVNTFVGMAVDPETGTPRVSFGTGGLSGPAIRPLAVRMVHQVHRALPGVPLWGIGGIETLSDVLEFLSVGASAVQVGTANFRDPGVSGRLVGELDAWCAARKTSVRELIGRTA